MGIVDKQNPELVKRLGQQLNIADKETISIEAGIYHLDLTMRLYDSVFQIQLSNIKPNMNEFGLNKTETLTILQDHDKIVNKLNFMQNDFISMVDDSSPEMIKLISEAFKDIHDKLDLKRNILVKKLGDLKIITDNVALSSPSLSSISLTTPPLQLLSDSTQNFLPKIIKPLMDKSQKFGLPCIFEVELDDVVPDTKVIWCFNDTPIDEIKNKEFTTTKDGTKFKLTISNVDNRHIGKYTFITRNERGEVQTSANLEHISARPSPRYPMSPATGSLTSTSSLNINDIGRRSVSSTLEISVTDSKKAIDDSGGGRALKNAEWGSNVPPKFLKRLNTIIAHEGDAIKFQAQISGNPEIRWFREGVEILNSPDFCISQENDYFFLEIPEIFLEDAGKFTCIAQNFLGSDQCSADLIVQVPSEIGSMFGSVESSLEDVKVALSMSAKSSDVYLVPNTMVHVNKLLVDSPAHIGSVSEQFKKPYFRAISKDLEVGQGHVARFDSIVAGKPNPDVTWYKDGRLINSTSDNKYLATVNEKGITSLTIQKVDLNDGGVYKCVASNRAGQEWFNVVLKVTPGLKIARYSPTNSMTQITRPHSPKIKTISRNFHSEERPQQQQLQQQQHQQFSRKFQSEERRITRRNFYKKANFDETFGNGPPTKTMKMNYEYANGRSLKTNDNPSFGAPQLIEPITDPEVSEGQTAILSCRVSCSTACEFEWFFNGEPFVPDPRKHKISVSGDKYTLEIKSIDQSDRGFYQCTVSNEDGEVSCIGRLNPIGLLSSHSSRPREIISSRSPAPSPYSYTTVHEVKLSCTVTGDPTPTLTWYLNDQLLDETSENVTTFYDTKTGLAELTILDVTRYSGVVRITCVAENERGRAETVCTLNETILRDPLIVDSNYSRILVHQIGDRHQNIVSRKTGPRFSRRVQPCLVEKGETITLTAVVHGRPRPLVTWLKDGSRNWMPLTTEKYEVTYDEQRNICQLIIRNCTYEDSGLYSCVAYNPTGQSTCSASIIVADSFDKNHSSDSQSGKPSLKKTPKFNVTLEPRREVKLGEPVRFQCRILREPTTSVTWYFNGVEISTGHSMKEVDGDIVSTLVISDPQLSNSGEYACQARNFYGASRTTTYLLVDGVKSGDSTELSQIDTLQTQPSFCMPILETYSLAPPPDSNSNIYNTPPTFSLPLVNRVSTEGSEVLFIVKFDGHPSPSIQWFTNGNLITEKNNKCKISTDFRKKESMLYIRAVSIGDEGEYTCKIENISGVAYSTSHLYIRVITYTDDENIEENRYTSELNYQLQPEKDGRPKFNVDLKLVAGDFKTLSSCLANKEVIFSDDFEQRKMEIEKQFILDYPADQQFSETISIDQTTNKTLEFEIQTEKPKRTSEIFVQNYNLDRKTSVISELDIELTKIPTFSETVSIDSRDSVLQVLPIPTQSPPEILSQQDYELRKMTVESEFELAPTPLFSETVAIDKTEIQEVLFESPAINKLSEITVHKEASLQGIKMEAEIILVEEPQQFSETVSIDRTENKTHQIEITVPKENKTSELVIHQQSALKGMKLEAEILPEPIQKSQLDIDTGYAPRFIIELVPTNVMDGSSVNFTTKITAQPMPHFVSWYRNEKNCSEIVHIITDYDIKTGESNLHIAEVFPEDSGQYTCVAANKYGTAKSSAYLTVSAYEVVTEENMSICSDGSMSNFSEIVEVIPEKSEIEPLDVNKAKKHITRPTFLAFSDFQPITDSTLNSLDSMASEEKAELSKVIEFLNEDYISLASRPSYNSQINSEALNVEEIDLIDTVKPDVTHPKILESSLNFSQSSSKPHSLSMIQNVTLTKDTVEGFTDEDQEIRKITGELIDTNFELFQKCEQPRFAAIPIWTDFKSDQISHLSDTFEIFKLSTQQLPMKEMSKLSSVDVLPTLIKQLSPDRILLDSTNALGHANLDNSTSKILNSNFLFCTTLDKPNVEAKEQLLDLNMDGALEIKSETKLDRTITKIVENEFKNSLVRPKTQFKSVLAETKFKNESYSNYCEDIIQDKIVPKHVDEELCFLIDKNVLATQTRLQSPKQLDSENCKVFDSMQPKNTTISCVNLNLETPQTKARPSILINTQNIPCNIDNYSSDFETAYETENISSNLVESTFYKSSVIPKTLTTASCSIVKFVSETCSNLINYLESVDKSSPKHIDYNLIKNTHRSQLINTVRPLSPEIYVFDNYNVTMNVNEVKLPAELINSEFIYSKKNNQPMHWSLDQYTKTNIDQIMEFKDCTSYDAANVDIERSIWTSTKISFPLVYCRTVKEAGKNLEQAEVYDHAVSLYNADTSRFPFINVNKVNRDIQASLSDVQFLIWHLDFTFNKPEVVAQTLKYLYINDYCVKYIDSKKKPIVYSVTQHLSKQRSPSPQNISEIETGAAVEKSIQFSTFKPSIIDRKEIYTIETPLKSDFNTCHKLEEIRHENIEILNVLSNFYFSCINNRPNAFSEIQNILFKPDNINEFNAVAQNEHVSGVTEKTPFHKPLVTNKTTTNANVSIVKFVSETLSNLSNILDCVDKSSPKYVDYNLIQDSYKSFFTTLVRPQSPEKLKFENYNVIFDKEENKSCIDVIKPELVQATKNKPTQRSSVQLLKMSISETRDEKIDVNYDFADINIAYSTLFQTKFTYPLVYCKTTIEKNNMLEQESIFDSVIPLYNAKISKSPFKFFDKVYCDILPSFSDVQFITMHFDCTFFKPEIIPQYTKFLYINDNFIKYINPSRNLVVYSAVQYWNKQRSLSPQNMSEITIESANENITETSIFKATSSQKAKTFMKSITLLVENEKPIELSTSVPVEIIFGHIVENLFQKSTGSQHFTYATPSLVKHECNIVNSSLFSKLQPQISNTSFTNFFETSRCVKNRLFCTLSTSVHYQPYSDIETKIESLHIMTLKPLYTSARIYETISFMSRPLSFGPVQILITNCEIPDKFCTIVQPCNGCLTTIPTFTQSISYKERPWCLVTEQILCWDYEVYKEFKIDLAYQYLEDESDSQSDYVTPSDVDVKPYEKIREEYIPKTMNISQKIQKKEYFIKPIIETNTFEESVVNFKVVDHHRASKDFQSQVLYGKTDVKKTLALSSAQQEKFKEENVLSTTTQCTVVQATATKTENNLINYLEKTVNKTFAPVARVKNEFEEHVTVYFEDKPSPQEVYHKEVVLDVSIPVAKKEKVQVNLTHEYNSEGEEDELFVEARESLDKIDIVTSEIHVKRPSETRQFINATSQKVDFKMGQVQNLQTNVDTLSCTGSMISSHFTHPSVSMPRPTFIRTSVGTAQQHEVNSMHTNDVSIAHCQPDLVTSNFTKSIEKLELISHSCSVVELKKPENVKLDQEPRFKGLISFPENVLVKLLRLETLETILYRTSLLEYLMLLEKELSVKTINLDNVSMVLPFPEIISVQSGIASVDQRPITRVQTNVYFVKIEQVTPKDISFTYEIPNTSVLPYSDLKSVKVEQNIMSRVTGRLEKTNTNEALKESLSEISSVLCIPENLVAKLGRAESIEASLYRTSLLEYVMLLERILAIKSLNLDSLSVMLPFPEIELIKTGIAALNEQPLSRTQTSVYLLMMENTFEKENRVEYFTSHPIQIFTDVEKISSETKPLSHSSSVIEHKPHEQAIINAIAKITSTLNVPESIRSYNNRVRKENEILSRVSVTEYIMLLERILAFNSVNIENSSMNLQFPELVLLQTGYADTTDKLINRVQPNLHFMRLEQTSSKDEKVEVVIANASIIDNEFNVVEKQIKSLCHSSSNIAHKQVDIVEENIISKISQIYNKPQDIVSKYFAADKAERVLNRITVANYIMLLERILALAPLNLDDLSVLLPVSEVESVRLLRALLNKRLLTRTRTSYTYLQLEKVLEQLKSEYESYSLQSTLEQSIHLEKSIINPKKPTHVRTNMTTLKIENDEPLKSDHLIEQIIEKKIITQNMSVPMVDEKPAIRTQPSLSFVKIENVTKKETERFNKYSTMPDIIKHEMLSNAIRKRTATKVNELNIIKSIFENYMNLNNVESMTLKLSFPETVASTLTKGITNQKIVTRAEAIKLLTKLEQISEVTVLRVDDMAMVLSAPDVITPDFLSNRTFNKIVTFVRTSKNDVKIEMADRATLINYNEMAIMLTPSTTENKFLEKIVTQKYSQFRAKVDQLILILESCKDYNKESFEKLFVQPICEEVKYILANEFSKEILLTHVITLTKHFLTEYVTDYKMIDVKDLSIRLMVADVTYDIFERCTKKEKTSFAINLVYDYILEDFLEENERDERRFLTQPVVSLVAAERKEKSFKTPCKTFTVTNYIKFNQEQISQLIVKPLIIQQTKEMIAVEYPMFKANINKLVIHKKEILEKEEPKIVNKLKKEPEKPDQETESLFEEWSVQTKSEFICEKKIDDTHKVEKQVFIKKPQIVPIEIESRKIDQEEEYKEDMYEEWETIVKKEYIVENEKRYEDSDNESDISTQSLYEEWEFTTITRTVVEEEFPSQRNVVEIRYPQKCGTNIILGNETTREDEITSKNVQNRFVSLDKENIREINKQYTFNQFGLKTETFDENHKRPVFDKEITTNIIKIGQQVILTTHVISKPEPTSIEWYKDGVKITESNNYVMKYENGYCLLIINKFSSRHIGRYSCRVLNEFGINESNITIEKNMITDYKVKFDDDAINQMQYELTIKRQQTNQPKIILKKESDNFIVTEEESFIETKETWSKVTSETYRNQAVDITSSELEHPLGPPSAPFFEQEISSITVIDGTTATISCRLFSYPIATIEWYFSGRKIEKSRDFIMWYKDGYCYLAIKDVMPTDQGRYTIKATNELGSAETYVYLTVMDSYEFNRKSEKSMQKSSSFDSSDELYSSGEETTDMWTVEEWIFYDNVKYYNVDVFLKKQQLYVTNFTYVPYTEKSFKERISSIKAALMDNHMFRFPVIIKELPIIEVFEKRKAVLECVVEASPEPVITWFKNGKVITSDEHVKITFQNNVCTLTIDHVTLEDEAEYKCEAKNDFGSSFTWGQIYVESVQLRWGRIKNFKIVRKKSI